MVKRPIILNKLLILRQHENLTLNPRVKMVKLHVKNNYRIKIPIKINYSNYYYSGQLILIKK